jgi:hypothetical protein
MLDRRFRECAGVAILAVVVCAAPVWAQRPRPDRPYRGLFGGNGGDPNSTQQLDLNISLFAAYDQNILADTGQIGIDPRFQKSGNVDNGTISLDYTRRAGHATIDFTGGTSYRYYPSSGQMNGATSFVSGGLTEKLSPVTDFKATESVSYLPFYSLGAVPGLTPGTPGDIAPIITDYPLVQDSAISVSSSASLEHRLSPRESLSADYLAQFTRYRASDRAYDNWLAGGRYSHKLSGRASIRFGYHYRRLAYTVSGASQPTDGHDLDFGMDYTRPLSPSRTMKYGFTVGTSIYRSLAMAHYLATASGYVDRQISRSWSAGLSYNRGVQYVAGFPNPFFSDSVTARLNGFISSRSRVNLSAAYSNGQAGIATSNQGYSTYSGVAGYQLAVGRFTALFAEYHYYHYIFDPTVVLPVGMNRGLDRQSVRLGLNLWVPLLR